MLLLRLTTEESSPILTVLRPFALSKSYEIQVINQLILKSYNNNMKQSKNARLGLLLELKNNTLFSC